ncbi:diguanylate cyclase [Pseudohalioglobus lutimaris]|uniref:GGDEF domain-containing protein n=1 Tax=Pseudohalioglobus lutimaris TaxID=1737061 RepID=A0A2N5X5D6_9GAMM|nr:diguanylate cyclase [Pseudohalioglobus lutimaris]PLW69691.1 GGDEF domain-containing protein [Pseudohalioglobus lutimaris]
MASGSMNCARRGALRLPLILAATLAGLVYCGYVMSMEVTGTEHPLAKEVEYLTDPSGRLTLQEILERPALHTFKPAKEADRLTPYKPIWVRLELKFGADKLENRYNLLARQQSLYDIRIYRADANGRYQETVTGDNHPADTRELAQRRYGFLVQPSAQTETLYLRYIGGPGATRFTWDLLEEDTAQQQMRTSYFLNIASISALAALLMFNTGLALTLRKPEYGWYCGYHFFVMLTLLTLDGFGFLYFWPNTPALNERALHVFNLLASSMRVMAIMYFLGSAKFAPRIHRLGQGIIALILLTAAWVAIAGVSNLPRFAAPLPWALSVLYGLTLCAYAIYQRVSLAAYLFLVLLVPGLASFAQAVIIVSSNHPGPFELQVAKVGFLIHTLLFSLCLAARLKLQTESRKQALYDNLTGLPGTTLLQKRFELGTGLSQLEGKALAVLFVDLDGFKAVNDEMGHAAGDQLLKITGERMRSTLRETDTVSRIGGDEFAILLPNIEGLQAAEHVATKLLHSVSEACQLAGGSARVSASIGIALYPSQGEHLETLLKAADTAMYRSKREGKNRYCSSAPRQCDMDKPGLAGRSAGDNYLSRHFEAST